MNDLQELLTSLDKLFNTTGNRLVAVNLFNIYAQREDIPVQDYSIGKEHLFYRAYLGVDPNQSIFLMDRFISGLVSPQIKEKLRIPLSLWPLGKQSTALWRLKPQFSSSIRPLDKGPLLERWQHLAVIPCWPNRYTVVKRARSRCSSHP